MKSRILFVWLLLFNVVMASATQRETFGDSVKYHFNAIVVTATKVADAQRDIAASISVIDSMMIHRASTFSVLELVSQQTPGVFITERAVMGYGVAAGAAGGISIRGVGGSPVTEVLVLRDGRPDIMGLMGHPIPDAYALDGVERIEIVRGPASFLYGTNAMGGVINIVSESMKTDGFKTRLNAGLGTYNSTNLQISHGGKMGAFEYHVSAARRKTDGHRDFSNFTGDYFTAHLGYQLSHNTKISFNSNLSNLDILDPGPITSPVQDHWYKLRRSGADLSLVHRSVLGETNIKLHGNFGRHKIYDGFRSHDHTIGVMFYQNIKPFSGNTTTIGFDLKKYGGDAENITKKFSFGDFEITEYAPYIHIQQLLFKRFIASAGARVEHHELYGFETVPKFGLVTHLMKTTSLRLSASKGFRSPSIRELYLFPAPNPNLKPERMWNYEVGLTQHIGTRAKFDGALFRSEGSQLIRLQGQWPNFTLVNSGEFVHTGYELSFEYLPIDPMLVSLSWTKLDLADETRNSPGKKLTAYVTYNFSRLTLSLTVDHIRDLYGADFRKERLPDYTLVNLYSSIHLVKGLGLTLRAKNILDEEYETMFGYPMPGRTFTLDVNYQL